MKNMRSLILNIVLLLFFINTGHGQDKTHETVVTMMSFGDWLVRCEKVDAVSEPCTMTQKILSQDGKQQLAEANIAKNGDATLLTIVVPLGVYLPAGVELEVVDWEKRKYEYSFCATSGCFVNELLDEKIVELLRKKDKAVLTLHTTETEKVNVPISISGFLDAYKKL